MEQVNELTVVLLEPAIAENLKPLLENRSPAMLPVAGKPLVQYWCEHLNMAGIKNVHLVLRHMPETVRHIAGNGERWGLNLSISTIPETTDNVQCLKLTRPYVSGKALIFSITSLPEKRLDSWLTQIAEIQPETVSSEQVQENLFDGLILEKSTLDHLLQNQTCELIAPPKESFRQIDSARSLWQANMDLLNGLIEDPLPTGFEGEKGLSLQVGVQIKPGFHFEAPCQIGQHTLLESRTRLGPSVSIGRNCIIDNSCRIRESVIMDNSYIGSHSDLQRVIVDGRLIFQLDLDMATWIDDPMILSFTNEKRQVAGFSDRFLAGVAFALGLPLLLLGVLVNRVKKTRAFIPETLSLAVGRDLNGDISRRELKVHTLNVPHRLWRKLPWLLQVIRGELRLVGISPQIVTSNTSNYKKAEGIPCERPGVINLYDLARDEDRSVDHMQISDSYYVATRGIKNDLLLFFRWLAALFLPGYGQ